jgi:hypothetical protein
MRFLSVFSLWLPPSLRSMHTELVSQCLPVYLALPWLKTSIVKRRAGVHLQLGSMSPFIFISSTRSFVRRYTDNHQRVLFRCVNRSVLRRVCLEHRRSIVPKKNSMLLFKIESIIAQQEKSSSLHQRSFIPACRFTSDLSLLAKVEQCNLACILIDQITAILCKTNKQRERQLC